MSRRIGGIHFEEGDIRGRIMGRQIGYAASIHAAKYFGGSGALRKQR
jgi:hypothetical protein